MAEQKKKKRRNPTGRFLHVLILIVAILVIFEGRMVINIFTRHGIKAQITQQLDELFADMKTETPETEQKAETKKKICQKPRSAQDRAGFLQPKAEPFLHPAVQRPCHGLEVSLGSLVENIDNIGRL